MNLWLVWKYRLWSHDRMRVHVQILQMLESKPTNYNWAFELTSGTAVAPGLALKHVRMSWANYGVSFSLGPQGVLVFQYGGGHIEDARLEWVPTSNEDL